MCKPNRVSNFDGKVRSPRIFESRGTKVVSYFSKFCEESALSYCKQHLNSYMVKPTSIG